jgi:hypothetical protein
MTDPAVSESIGLASKLDALAQLPSNDTEWSHVESIAQVLANTLRDQGHGMPSLPTTHPDLCVSNSEDVRTALGGKHLPQSLTTILKSAAQSSRIPAAAQLPAIHEILRVAANLCMDHGKYSNLSLSSTKRLI